MSSICCIFSFMSIVTIGLGGDGIDAEAVAAAAVDCEVDCGT